jgi:hypothetical protein
MKKGMIRFLDIWGRNNGPAGQASKQLKFGFRMAAGPAREFSPSAPRVTTGVTCPAAGKSL